MPEQSARLGIPLPLGNENVSRQAIREMLQAVDDHAETIAGAQAKADATEAAAKAYADSAAGSAAGVVASALTAHKAETATLIDMTNTNNYVFNTEKNITIQDGKLYTFIIGNTPTGNVKIKIDDNVALPLINHKTGMAIGSGKIRAWQLFQAWYSVGGSCFFLRASASGKAVAGDVLAGKTFSNDDDTDLVGIMPNRGAINQALAINGTYIIPAGYHDGSGKITQAITTKGAQTYTPSTVNQTIATGQYLSAAQTILGDPNLIGANILSGKSIFGVAGTTTITSMGGAVQKSGETEKVDRDITVTGLGLPSTPRVIMYRHWWQVTMAGASSYGATDFGIWGNVYGQGFGQVRRVYDSDSGRGVEWINWGNCNISNITADGFYYNGPVGSNVVNGGTLSYTVIC